MNRLLIDDLRHIEAEVVARTFDEGIEALKTKGPFDVLFLDHDLGDENPKKTGYGIMCFIEENLELKPKSIILITSNPVGRQNMQVVIDKLYPRKSK